MSTLTTVPALPAVFQAANIDYLAVAPMLAVFGAGLVGVLVEAFVPRESRRLVQLVVALVGLLAAFGLVIVALDHKGLTMGLSDGATGRQMFSLSIDGPALFLQGALVLMAVLAVLTMSDRLGHTGADAFTPSGASTPGSAYEVRAAQAGMQVTEVFPLALFSVGGMMMFVAANDLIGMFVALEVLSLPLYILSGLARRRRLLSQEAALKYFLLGAFSSAFFLFGTALLYGYAGSVYLGDLSRAVSAADGSLDGLLVAGAFLTFVGLLFKVGAVPFHAWTPDVYQGAPTPVTGFMAACTKVAAFGAILRLAYAGLDTARWDWENALVIVAILTMVVGAVMSVTQTDIKRLLAYSSIAHAGFILVGVLAFDVRAVGAVLFYLVAYGFSTIAAFAIVSLVRQNGVEATRLSQWAGLGRRHPVAAGAFAFLMLAFAGIPLTSGFVAKFGVFAAAIRTGGATGTVLAVIGVLCSAITVYVYAKVIVTMFFSDPERDGSRADGTDGSAAGQAAPAYATAGSTAGSTSGSTSGSTAVGAGEGPLSRPGATAAAAGLSTEEAVRAEEDLLTSESTDEVTVVVPSMGTTFAIAIGVMITLALGVLPSALLDLVDRASQFIR